MKEFKIHFSQEVYLKQLKINNILLTRREIDIVACLFHSLKTKKIADILSIRPRTVEKHISNIFTKLECNSREGVLGYLEKSEHILNLRKHCTNLVINSEFEKCLKGVSKKSLPENLKCTLSYDKDHRPEKGLIKQIVRHLELLKIRVNHCKWKHTLGTNEGKVIFLCLNNGDHIPEGLDYINFISGKNYYLMIFDLLQKLHSPILLDGSISEFKKKYRAIQNQHAPEKMTEGFVKKARAFIWEKKWKLTPALLLLCIGIVGLVSWKGFIPSQQTQVDSSIRSDLNTPTESILLQRPEIIAEIDTHLNKKDGIRTVVLVGPGGSGKTTLARQYAQSQKFPIVWEINAETKESTASSFEKLAERLAQSEQEKQTLKEFQEIKDVSKKQECILNFVKEHLKKDNHWLLIFDNVESLSELQDYIPRTTDTWGQGIVILTTRNINAQSNKYVNSIIRIGELTPHQKLTLFSKIMTSKNSQPLSLSQREEAIAFLKNIPSFPLDISVAAYYLKATNSSYAGYIETMNQNNKDFEEMQKELLKESGDYNKTRYNIISISLRNLINKNSDFGDLFLFISLLDSQNIPIDLLNEYKDKSVVDKFVYYLKSYSLIMPSEGSFSSLGSDLFIHRSTQAIALKYVYDTFSPLKKVSSVHESQKALERYLDEVVKQEAFSKMDTLKIHYEVFLSHKNLLSPVTRAFLVGGLGEIFYYFGDYKKANLLLQESLKYLNSEENSITKAKRLIYLGTVSKELGNYAKAKMLIDQGIEIYQKSSFENHPFVAWGLLNLANIYKESGEFDKAIKVLQKSIDIYTENEEENKIKLAWSLVYLGEIYRTLGKYQEAKALCEKGLKIYKNALGNDHVKTAWTLIYLGNIYVNLGRYNEAENFLEEAARIYKIYYSEDNIELAWGLVYLGNIYIHTGKYELAKNVLNQAYNIHIKNYGEENVRTAWSAVVLAVAFDKLGHLDKAKALLERYSALHKDHFGESHIRYAMFLKNLGNVYTHLKNYNEAKGCLKKALAIYEKHYGKKHTETAHVLRNLGQNYFLEGNVKISDQFLYRALEIFQKNSHPERHLVAEDLKQVKCKNTAYFYVIPIPK